MHSSYSSCECVGLLKLLRKGGSSATPPARRKSCRLPRSRSSADRQAVAVGTLRVGLEGRRSWAHSQSMKVEMCCGEGGRREEDRQGGKHGLMGEILCA